MANREIKFMTLKERIAEVIDKFQEGDCGNTKCPADSGCLSCQADKILSLIREELPKEKVSNLRIYIRDYDDGRKDGYNECLSDVKERMGLK